VTCRQPRLKKLPGAGPTTPPEHAPNLGSVRWLNFGIIGVSLDRPVGLSPSC
jgi:hypothetical protein